MTMRKGLPAKLALTDSDDTRYDFLNDVVTNADGSPRGGITSPVGTNIVTGRADMQVNVGRFAADAPRDGGVVKLANDGTIQVTIPNAPASGTRTHVIAARQDDASSTVTTPDADNVAKVYVIQDTGSGQPALPDGSVLVGTVAISAGQTTTNAATISQATQYTASSGGIVPFRTLAQLQAWTTARLGQVAEVIADATAGNNSIYRWNGTTWDGLGVWNSYTPTWTTPNSQPSIGNGTLTGEYAWLGGRTYVVRISIAFGSTTNGGTGAWTFGLPAGLTGAPGGEHILTTKAFTNGGNFGGVGVVAAGGSTITPLLSASGTSTVLGQVQNANSGGGTGTGVPAVSGQFTFANGSNFTVEGILHAA